VDAVNTSHQGNLVSNIFQHSNYIKDPREINPSMFSASRKDFVSLVLVLFGHKNLTLSCKLELTTTRIS
jgi:hypothetical protein